KMREWMIGQGIATAEELDALEAEDRKIVREAQRRAWEAYRAPIDAEVQTVVHYLEVMASSSTRKREIEELKGELQRIQAPFRRDAMRALTSALIAARGGEAIPEEIIRWREEHERINAQLYDAD